MPGRFTKPISSGFISEAGLRQAQRAQPCRTVRRGEPCPHPVGGTARPSIPLKRWAVGNADISNLRQHSKTKPENNCAWVVLNYPVIWQIAAFAISGTSPKPLALMCFRRPKAAAIPYPKPIGKTRRSDENARIFSVRRDSVARCPSHLDSKRQYQFA